MLTDAKRIDYKSAHWNNNSLFTPNLSLDFAVYWGTMKRCYYESLYKPHKLCLGNLIQSYGFRVIFFDIHIMHVLEAAFSK